MTDEIKVQLDRIEAKLDILIDALAEEDQESGVSLIDLDGKMHTIQTGNPDQGLG